MNTLFGEDGGATPYRVLARKYRPATFAELIGQEAMVRTLSNAVQAGRVPHAWMLTGVRGIGKTTTARLIAKALNCTGRDTKTAGIEPCNACEACCAIAEDRFVDVQEMDAASRTGVDDIREILDGVRYGPLAGRFKVYILDEVHMLSKNAFNALLKTLEEPPPHTKFIFATTEIRKVPVTVLSRCQRFDLRRIESAELAAHFAKICTLEGAQADPEALQLIAHAAEGSVRDGLSLLDQAIALGDGHVKEAEVKSMLGLASRGATWTLCRHIFCGAMGQALETYAQMIAVGVDPVQILQDLAETVHLLTRARIVPGEAVQQDLSEGERDLLASLDKATIPALSRAWQILLKGIGEAQNAPQPAVAAEMALIRLAYAAALPLPVEIIRQWREQQQPQKTEGLVVSHDEALAPPSVSTRFIATPREESAPPSPPFFTDPLDTMEAVAALFAEKREGGLYAEICRFARPIRIKGGSIILRLESGAPSSLPARMEQKLSAWTGQSWTVSLGQEEGEPTLSQKEEAAAQVRKDRAQAHPLMQGAQAFFPDAGETRLKRRAPPPATKDEAPLSVGEEDDPEVSAED